MPPKENPTIDYRGVPCPTPLLGAKKMLDKLEVGQTIRVISDCTATHDDLLSWCRHSGNILVSVTPAGIDGAAVYVLRKGLGADAVPVAHATLDARGLPCPAPIVKARNRLNAMKGGEVLQLLTDCTAAIDDVPTWAHEASIRLLHVKQIGRGAHEFYLRKP